MSDWTDERTATLRKMIADKKSAYETANALGMTRNAVLGKAFRLGLRFTFDPDKHAQRCREGTVRSWADPKARAARMGRLRAKRAAPEARAQ